MTTDECPPERAGRSWPLHVLRCASAEELSAIHRAGITMAVWQRSSLLPDAARELASLPIVAYPDVRIITDTPDADILAAFTAAADAAGVPHPLALAADATMLAGIYREVMGVKKILLRFELTTEAHRRLLHVDAVAMRLITTYRGLGTRWLGDEDACRQAIGKGRNGAIYCARSAVRRMQPCDVALVKGEEWPGNRGRGLVHGEPFVTRPTHQRMALIIDDAKFAPELHL